jgi:hypothetical protein
MMMRMMMRVIKTRATANETSSEIDLFDGAKLSKADKIKVAEEARDILQDVILKSVGNAKSPIKGESWPGLSKEYKAFKESKNRNGIANMELSGDMLDSLDGKVSATGKLTMGYFGSEAKKADGHNNFSGDSDLPQRRSLPGVDQVFKGGVEKQINELVREAVASNVKLPVGRLKQVTTRKGLFDILGEVFPNSSRVVITDLILSNDDLANTISDLGLLRFLSGSKNN